MLMSALAACVPMRDLPDKEKLTFWKERPPEKPIEYYDQGDSWCYKTLGEADCYPRIQDTLPERLVGVKPQLDTPPTREAYEATLKKTTEEGASTPSLTTDSPLH